MTHRGGINRAFSWIKKVLEVTEVTTVPDTVLPEVTPTLDMFGWERYTELQRHDAGQANANLSNLPVVPQGILRLYVALSGETNDTVNAFTHWMEVNAVAVTTPVTLPVSTVLIRAGHLANPILVREGLSVSARCSPTTAGGIVLRATGLFIDLPIGEYIPSL